MTLLLFVKIIGQPSEPFSVEAVCSNSKCEYLFEGCECVGFLFVAHTEGDKQERQADT